MKPPLPQAVVLGLELNGLGIVRSLARAPWQIPTVAFDNEPARPYGRTRHARVIGVPSLHDQGLIDRLLEHARGQTRRPVLFVTQEKTADLVSRNLETLKSAYAFTAPEPEDYRRLTEKTQFGALAEAGGFPVPRTVHVRSEADIDAACALAFPVALKPAKRNPDYERRFSKAYRISEPGALADRVREILPVAGELVVQEWIEGDDGAIHFCLQYRPEPGRALASFTGRKIRAWPPAVGGTASCVAAPAAEAELTALTDRFFSAHGGAGLVGMEYKQDSPTGRFLMVEPTVGRSDHQEEVATLNGVNIPLVAYAHLAGIAPPPPMPPPARPVIWRDSLADTLSARAQGSAAMPPGRVRDALARLDDPGPVMAKLAEAVRRRLGLSA